MATTVAHHPKRSPHERRHSLLRRHRFGRCGARPVGLPFGDGVTVSTSTGFAPGGDVEALATELGEPWYGNGYDQVRVESGEPIGEQQPHSDYENAYSVAVNAWEAYGSSA